MSYFVVSSNYNYLIAYNIQLITRNYCALLLTNIALLATDIAFLVMG
jgi:hypothetical protein